jgi:hypothetical protein
MTFCAKQRGREEGSFRFGRIFVLDRERPDRIS